MSSVVERLTALGRGAGQSVTGNWNDELSSKLLANIPFNDGTGIPRDYAGGSAEEQYKSEQRADNEDAQRRFPLNYGAGQILGAAPASIATLATGGLPAVGLGVLQGAVQGSGASTSNGRQLAKDTIAGAALGGGTAAAGNALQAAAPLAKKFWEMPPPSTGLQPVMSSAAAPVRVAPRPAPANINFNKSVSPSTQSFRPSTPPASLEQAEIEARAALARADSLKQLRERPFRPASGPLDQVPSKIPDAEGAVEGRRFVGEETGEAFTAPFGKGKAPKNELVVDEPLNKTVRPGKGRPR